MTPFFLERKLWSSTQSRSRAVTTTLKPLRTLLCLFTSLSLCLYPIQAQALDADTISSEPTLIKLESAEYASLQSQALPAIDWRLETEAPAQPDWLAGGEFTGNPELAGWLSTLFPGAGYLYINEPGKALLSAPLILPLMLPMYLPAQTYHANLWNLQSLYWSNLAMDWISFDVYQTALDKLGNPPRLLNIPHYSFLDMYLAPFNPKVYWSEHWQSNLFRYGMLGILLISTIVALATKGLHQDATLERGLFVIPASIAFAMMVGVGEESYFRGLVQMSSTELTQAPWAGNLIQASYFGLAHTHLPGTLHLSRMPYGLSAVADLTTQVDPSKEYRLPQTELSKVPQTLFEETISFGRTTAIGLMLGWMLEAEQNDDGMLKNIAWHAWFDSLGMINSFLLEGHTGRVGLMVSMPF